MFNSKARYVYNLYSLISGILLIPLFLGLAVLFLLNIFQIVTIIPEKLYIDINNPWMKLLTNSLFFGTIAAVIGFLYVIPNLIIKRKCMNLYAKECLEIINSTKLPEKLPKVLYVYTTHNDLIEARVLQNMKQTYKNFEVWVSDGSDNPQWREKIKNFCTKNNINLFQLDIKGSKNKADNLNQFLKQYNKDYDYLLIGDADEVFHENFVEYGIKMFCSNRIKNLSYITPLNVNYRSKGIYPNTTRIIETTTYWWVLLPKCFAHYEIPLLAGQSCLISRKSLIECNNEEKFDEGNLEDWYLETEMVEKMNYGLLLPNTPCYFEPDVNVNAHFSRIMRVQDWIIRWWKIRTKDIIKNYRESYSSWYKRYLVGLFTPLIIFMSLAVLSLTIWVLVVYWDFAFKDNLLFWITIGVSLFLLLINWITNSIVVARINFNFVDYLLYPLVIALWGFAAVINVTKHWFNALFLGKYSQFGGSGKARFFKGKSKTIKWWILLIIFTIMIIGFNVPIFMLTNYLSIRWLIIIFNIYFGTLWMSSLSYLLLWYINLIPYNKNFSRENWVETKEIFKV